MKPPKPAQMQDAPDGGKSQNAESPSERTPCWRAEIISAQNETSLKLAVCLDRNSEALRECAFELRRFQERVNHTGQ